VAHNWKQYKIISKRTSVVVLWVRFARFETLEVHAVLALIRDPFEKTNVIQNVSGLRKTDNPGHNAHFDPAHVKTMVFGFVEQSAHGFWAPRRATFYTTAFSLVKKSQTI